jgi:hypothetical protein
MKEKRNAGKDQAIGAVVDAFIEWPNLKKPARSIFKSDVKV